jgi:hypothetical protein
MLGPWRFDPVVFYTRNDDLYELGGGLTWELFPTWSLRPEILWQRDEGSRLAGNDSSTEI